MHAQASPQMPAAERRKVPRHRALLAGVLHEQNKTSTWSCMIRNLSDDGARLDIANPLWVPHEFAIEIDARNTHRLASVAWKNGTSIGVRFIPVSDAAAAGTLDQIRALRQERAVLERRISQLTE